MSIRHMHVAVTAVLLAVSLQGCGLTIAAKVLETAANPEFWKGLGVLVSCCAVFALVMWVSSLSERELNELGQGAIYAVVIGAGVVGVVYGIFFLGGVKGGLIAAGSAIFAFLIVFEA